ncbi:hypothetical protein [Fluviicola sp.]|uniref:hypothetical protein n=1 Tax=Fluviicola sp. TaxID=1917219 RepID=UPI002611570A|nr:hypothetical protein [Fluviicola sp.]
MKKSIRYCALIFVAAFFQSCNSESNKYVYSDVSKFKKLIYVNKQIKGVKFEITDVLFTESRKIEKINDNPEDPYVIFAVIKLDSVSYKQLTEQVKSEPAIDNVLLTKKSLRTWFPKSIKESISPKGRFFKFEKSVYNSHVLIKSNSYDGDFIFLDEDSIFLTLFSKRFRT